MGILVGHIYVFALAKASASDEQHRGPPYPRRHFVFDEMPPLQFLLRIAEFFIFRRNELLTF